MLYTTLCHPLVFANSRKSLWPEFPVEYTCPESFRLLRLRHIFPVICRLAQTATKVTEQRTGRVYVAKSSVKVF